MSVIRLIKDGEPDLECIVGLDWDTVSKTDWKAQRKDLKANGTAFIEIPVTRGDTNTVNVGQISGDVLPGQKSRLSLAGWVAHTFKSGTIVAVEKVLTGENEEVFWFCAVRDGQVVAGTDILGDWDDIDGQVSELLDMIGEAEVGFVGLDTDALTANEGGESTPAQLVSMLAKSGKKKAKLTVLAKSNKGVAILSVSLILVLAIGGGVWWVMSSAAKEEAAERARQQRIVQAQRAQQDYQNLLAEVAQNGQGWKKLAKLLHGPFDKLEPKIGGWLLQSVECDKTDCTLIFANTDLTDPSILEEGNKEVCEVLEISPAGIEGTCRFSIATAIGEGGEQGEQNDNAGQPMAQEEGEQNLMPIEQVRALRSSFMAYARYFSNSTYAINEAAPVNFSGKRFLNGVTLFEQGGWALGMPLEHLPYAIGMLKDYDNLSLDALTLNWGSKTIEISGLYYKEGDSE